MKILLLIIPCIIYTVLAFISIRGITDKPPDVVYNETTTLKRTYTDGELIILWDDNSSLVGLLITKAK
jgi:hypothetical protein